MKTECAAAVFCVKNLEASMKFYIEVLGFTEEFIFGEYAGIEHGNVTIHLAQAGHPNVHTPGTGNVYIFCDEVDEYHKTITAKGANTKTAPKDWPYGMRDFIVLDPDGNQLAFGTPVKKN